MIREMSYRKPRQIVLVACSNDRNNAALNKALSGSMIAVIGYKYSNTMSE